jgi:hypothetical protein
VAKQRVEAKRQRGAKKSKAAVRAKSGMAPTKAASKELARKTAPKKVKKKPAARKPSKPVSPVASAEVERAAARPTEPKPQAFFDPQGGQKDFTGDTKAHTKPEDQRGHIRMTAPRTWSNRQPGRG